MTDNNENKVLNVPHLRFPKFSGEWEICKVSELLDFYSTNSLSWEQLEYGGESHDELTLWTHSCWASYYGGFEKR